MANVYFNKKFEVCPVNACPDYLYVDDVEAFIRECGDDWIADDVEEAGVYYWNDTHEVWRLADVKTDLKIREIIKTINNITKVKSDILTDWNILVTLDTGETIKMNSELISIDDVQEAINILLKPSFFGKRIKKFEIVAE